MDNVEEAFFDHDHDVVWHPRLFLEVTLNPAGLRQAIYYIYIYILSAYRSMGKLHYPLAPKTIETAFLELQKTNHTPKRTPKSSAFRKKRFNTVQ
jgi:hypothetical protein